MEKCAECLRNNCSCLGSWDCNRSLREWDITVKWILYLILRAFVKVRDFDLHQLMLLPAFYMVFRFKFTQRWNQSKKPSPMVTNYEVWQQKFQQDLIKFKFTAWMKPSLEIYLSFSLLWEYCVYIFTALYDANLLAWSVL